MTRNDAKFNSMRNDHGPVYPDNPDYGTWEAALVQALRASLTGCAGARGSHGGQNGVPESGGYGRIVERIR